MRSRSAEASVEQEQPRLQLAQTGGCGIPQWTMGSEARPEVGTCDMMTGTNYDSQWKNCRKILELTTSLILLGPCINMLLAARGDAHPAVCAHTEHGMRLLSHRKISSLQRTYKSLFSVLLLPICSLKFPCFEPMRSYVLICF